jgi:hypothetical protein
MGRGCGRSGIGFVRGLRRRRGWWSGIRRVLSERSE